VEIRVALEVRRERGDVVEAGRDGHRFLLLREPGSVRPGPGGHSGAGGDGNHRSTASTLFSPVVLNAIAASGACCRMRLTTSSNSSTNGSGLRMPPPTTTQP